MYSSSHVKTDAADNWIERFGLNLKQDSTDGNIILLSYGLDYSEVDNRYHLTRRQTVSATREQLLLAYNRPTLDLPKEDQFIRTISNRRIFLKALRSKVLTKDTNNKIIPNVDGNELQ